MGRFDLADVCCPSKICIYVNKKLMLWRLSACNLMKQLYIVDFTSHGTDVITI